jgi:2-methylcitrate dehydratase PrpD
MSKPLHGGHAADSGVLAAVAASKGVTGALDILEGREGFGAAMSVNPDWSRATRAWAATIIVHVTFKNMAAAATLFRQSTARCICSTHTASPRDIKRVRLAT